MEAWGVVALLALGAALRGPGLARFPFEQDEYYSILESRDLFHTTLVPGIDARPLYYLIEHQLLGLLPQTSFWLRFPAFVFGVLGLVAVWWLARRIFGVTGGLAALVFATISPWHLYASGMMRYWSLIFLLSAVAAGLIHRVSGGATRSASVGAVAFMALGLLTHPTFIIPLAGVGFGLCWMNREGHLRWQWPWRGPLWRVWLAFLAIVVVEWLVLRSTGRAGAVRNWGGRGVAASLRLLPAITDWVTPALLATAAFGTLAMIWRGTGAYRRWGVMALGGAAAMGTGLFLASIATDVYPDYAMSALPFVFVSAGGAIAMLGETAPRSRSMGLAAGATIVIAMLPSTVSHLSDGTRFDYRPALAEIERLAPDVPVVMWPEVIANNLSPTTRTIGLRISREFLDTTLAGNRRLWAVASVKRHGLAMDDSGVYETWLLKNCSLRFRSERIRLDYRRHGVELYWCESSISRPIGGG